MQLRIIQECNKQLCAASIRHAATRIYKDKRRAHLLRALYGAPQDQQQQPTEPLMGQHSNNTSLPRQGAAAQVCKAPLASLAVP